jgi:hypothetical protein
MGLGMDCEGSKPPAAKIQSAELCKMAEEGSGGRASVIIELDLPPQQVHIDSTPRRTGERSVRHFLEETREQQQAAESTVQEASAFLESTLGEAPRWLRAARAFVADVTPEQLRIVAGSPLVKTIRLNRHIDARV